MTWRDRNGPVQRQIKTHAIATLADGRPAYTARDLKHGLSDDDARKLAAWINDELEREGQYPDG